MTADDCFRSCRSRNFEYLGHQGMNVKSYDLCLVVDLDGVGQAGRSSKLTALATNQISLDWFCKTNLKKGIRSTLLIVIQMLCDIYHLSYNKCGTSQCGEHAARKNAS